MLAPMTKKRRSRLVLLACIVLGLVWWYRSSHDSSTTANAAPDDQVAHHIASLCKIAKHNVDTPKRGVQKMFHYLGHHAPDMMKQLGETFVAIERIADDEAHDRRAREARDRIQAPARRCAGTFEQFFAAVEADPEASALLERGLTRFGRTIDIIFGADAARLLPVPSFDR
jgi:hypothetical protein